MAEQPRRTGYFPALDSLRGVAALIVGVLHSFLLAGKPDLGRVQISNTLYAGFLAVDFFFVLSGFVLFLPVARRDGEIGGYVDFLIKRFTRLLPVYAVILAGAVAAQHLTETPAAALPPSAAGSWNVFAHLVMLPTVLLGFGNRTGLGVDPVVWSLSIEMCFSLVLPLIARWWFRHPVLGLGVALVISRGWDFVTTTWGPGRPAGPAPTTTVFYAGARVVIALPAYALHFGVGMSLAYLVARHGATLRTRLAGGAASGMFWLGVVSAGATACFLGSSEWHFHSGYRHWTNGALMLPAFALVILGAGFAAGRTARLLEHPAARRLGAVTYPFYLVHFVVMQGAQHRHHVLGWPGFVFDLATLPVSFLLAMALHRFIEVPTTEWGRRVARRRGASATARRGAPARPVESLA